MSTLEQALATAAAFGAAVKAGKQRASRDRKRAKREAALLAGKCPAGIDPNRIRVKGERQRPIRPPGGNPPSRPGQSIFDGMGIPDASRITAARSIPSKPSSGPSGGQLASIVNSEREINRAASYRASRTARADAMLARFRLVATAARTVKVRQSQRMVRDGAARSAVVTLRPGLTLPAP